MDPFSNLSESQSAHDERNGKAMSSMDDENPDPRQMGAMMRKMCEMNPRSMGLGRSCPKIGGGHSPDELEEKLGSTMEDGKRTTTIQI